MFYLKYILLAKFYRSIGERSEVSIHKAEVDKSGYNNKAFF